MTELPMPKQGGSYVRQPDGSLMRQFEISGDGAGEALPEIDADATNTTEPTTAPRARRK